MVVVMVAVMVACACAACAVAAWSLTALKASSERTRAAQQLAENVIARYDALVQRLSVDRSARVAPALPDLPPRAEDKPYISDLPHDDKHWNDFIGVEDDE